MGHLCRGLTSVLCPVCAGARRLSTTSWVRDGKRLHPFPSRRMAAVQLRHCDRLPSSPGPAPVLLLVDPNRQHMFGRNRRPRRSTHLKDIILAKPPTVGEKAAMPGPSLGHPLLASTTVHRAAWWSASRRRHVLEGVPGGPYPGRVWPRRGRTRTLANTGYYEGGGGGREAALVGMICQSAVRRRSAQGVKPARRSP